MNRLVIIGNGFDLAHGLPTSYGHFIDDYINNILKKLSKDKKTDDAFLTIDISRNNDLNAKNDFNKIENYNSLVEFINRYYKYCNFNINNKFFEIIITNLSIYNWVDIENKYYNELKKIVKSTSINIVEKKQKVIVLNKEFEQVKNLLENYLAKKVNVKSAFENDTTNVDIILSFFKIQFKYLDATSDDKNTIKYFKEFNNVDEDDLISFDFKVINASQRGSLNEDLQSGFIEQNNLFLNYNYTETIKKYIEKLTKGECFGKVEEVQIHGNLKDFENKINFGFGDEMDEDYKLIENIDDNEYLKNFKSFGYSQNPNYRKLLDFIDTNKFQVFIMGHSCGLSDRTLLNTIFEHQNCRSIKVYYYQWVDKKTEEIKDNYTEIIQNISRHFGDKKMMRSKVVNKMSCEALPQKIISK